MRKQRIKLSRIGLALQIQDAAQAAAAEPLWPATPPSPAELQAAAVEFRTLFDELGLLESDVRAKRFAVRQSEARVRALMRRVDEVTTAIFGPTDSRKGLFGVPPLDRNPTRSPIPPQVDGVAVSDGPAPGSIKVDWKAVRRAVYEVEWFDRDPGAEGALRLGSSIATASQHFLFGIPAGTELWFRIRALRGKRFGDWSEPVRRIVN